MTTSRSKTLLVILQNAWGTSDGYYPSYDVPAFANSLTGKRLKWALPDNCKITITNASGLVGETADSVFPADIEHVRAAIRRHKPDVILACGVIAQQAFTKIKTKKPVVLMPHPTYRLFSKVMAGHIRQELEGLL